MPHTLDVSRLAEIFDQLENDDRLTKWERNFIESVKAQYEDGRKLSDRQLETLEQVYVKY